VRVHSEISGVRVWPLGVVESPNFEVGGTLYNSAFTAVAAVIMEHVIFDVILSCALVFDARLVLEIWVCVYRLLLVGVVEEPKFCFLHDFRFNGCCCRACAYIR
ncbi:unnamed protein product, partial [Pylaiella littoralis]